MIAERVQSTLDHLLGRPMDYASLRQCAADLQHENNRLRLENARLRHENRRLRKHHPQVRRDVRLIEAAYLDALCLCAWFIAGLSISRRDCQRAGMPPRKWVRARALLRMARVHNGHTLTTTNSQELEAALQQAKRSAEQTPARLTLYLPNPTKSRAAVSP